MCYFKEISILESVWKLVNTWDGIWNKYKGTQFWNIQVTDIKSIVDVVFNQLNILVDGLNNKKWEVIETTRNIIDEFCNLLPLIENLKNPALKVRHWNEIRSITNKLVAFS